MKKLFKKLTAVAIILALIAPATNVFAFTGFAAQLSSEFDSLETASVPETPGPEPEPSATKITAAPLTELVNGKSDFVRAILRMMGCK
jgi:hypothetical protein